MAGTGARNLKQNLILYLIEADIVLIHIHYRNTNWIYQYIVKMKYMNI